MATYIIYGGEHKAWVHAGDATGAIMAYLRMAGANMVVWTVAGNVGCIGGMPILTAETAK